MPANGGAPRRLGSGTEVEVSPAFSPDSREIAYASWNDREGGHVWRRSRTGGRPTRLTEVPGQYANPSFSADGSKVVFVRGSGAPLREDDLGDELWLEVRWVSRSGGASHYVASVANRGASRRMPRPGFSPDGARIYFVDDEPAEQPTTPPRTVLYSTTLDGADKRAHLRFTRAEEIAISPDARYVAVTEQHDAWVTALPSASDAPIEVALENGALPVRRLSDEGGEWVAWARGGEAISFVHGPEVRLVQLAEALRLPQPEPEQPAGEGESAGASGESKDEKKPELPPSTTIAVELALSRARARGAVAYTGARIVTMRGDEVIERGAIVVDDDRITAVGAEGEVAIPAGAKRVDLSGRTIIPGLFDEHAHLHYSTLDVLPQQPWKYLANLAYGVTSTHDVSAIEPRGVRAERARRGGPDDRAAHLLDGLRALWRRLPSRTHITSLDDARKTLRRMKAMGAFSREVVHAAGPQSAAVDRAGRARGGNVGRARGRRRPRDGHDDDSRRAHDHRARAAVRAARARTCSSSSRRAAPPTRRRCSSRTVGSRATAGSISTTSCGRTSASRASSRSGIIDPLGRIRGVMATDPADWHHLERRRLRARSVTAGGRVVNLGGHGQMQGLGPHWEMWTFVQAGMTPLEALRVATLNPAKTLGLDRDLGSLEPGKLADFAVLEKNPLEHIENSETIALVVKNGVAYTPDDLARTRAAHPDPAEH